MSQSYGFEEGYKVRWNCAEAHGAKVIRRLLGETLRQVRGQGRLPRAASQGNRGGSALQISPVSARQFSIQHVERPLFSRRQAFRNLLDEQVHHGFVRLTLRTRV